MVGSFLDIYLKQDLNQPNMLEEKKLTEQESLELISAMIQKVKNSYHDTGVGSLMWGTVVFIASFVSFLRYRYNFTIGFDIWLIVLLAIVPQVYLSLLSD